MTAPDRAALRECDSPVGTLVAAARDGDTAAWAALVDRFAGLVVSICRRHRLDDSDTADVSQTVWLRLVERLPSVREPEALPGWLVTTTRHECLRVLRAGQRHSSSPLDDQADLADDTVVEDGLLDAELHGALRQAFGELPDRCRQLLTLLLGEPAPGYDVVSSTLDMPVGSIGPTRARCLHKLRRCPALTALLRDDELPPASRHGTEVRDGAAPAVRR